MLLLSGIGNSLSCVLNCADLSTTNAPDAKVHKDYINYLVTYRQALAEKNVDLLEDKWRKLDEAWMPIRYWYFPLLQTPLKSKYDQHHQVMLHGIGCGSRLICCLFCRIQVVHDIEYGYGDPLRTKCTPEFSIRLMDEAYAAENATIQKVRSPSCHSIKHCLTILQSSLLLQIRSIQ